MSESYMIQVYPHFDHPLILTDEIRLSIDVS